MVDQSMVKRMLIRVFARLLIILSLTGCAQLSQPLPTGSITRIAFGSCAKQWQPQPIWKAVAAVNPDLFIFVGDAIYGDWHGEKNFTPTTKTLRADWQKLGSISEFAAVRQQVPFMATWDNHDYVSHDGVA